MRHFRTFMVLIIFVSFLSQSIIAKNEESIRTEDKVGNDLLLLKYEFNNYNYLIASSEISENDVSRKSPWLAFGLSMMFPGLGQIYNGDYTKAAIMGGMVLLGGGLAIGTACVECGDAEPIQTSLLVTGFALMFSGYVWSLFDAPISANNINSRLNMVNRQESNNMNSNKFANNHRSRFPANNLISLKIEL